MYELICTALQAESTSCYGGEWIQFGCLAQRISDCASVGVVDDGCRETAGRVREVAARRFHKLIWLQVLYELAKVAKCAHLVSTHSSVQVLFGLTHVNEEVPEVGSTIGVA